MGREIPRSREELQEFFDESVYYLKSSAKIFDEERIIPEAKRLASAARTLLHDTAKSDSLLHQLDLLDSRFVDSAQPVIEGNTKPHAGLIQVHIGSSKVTTYPLLDCGLQTQKISFDKWWHGIVFINEKKQEFSRKDIVTFLANKEVNHVSPTVDPKFVALKSGTSMGWKKTDSSGHDQTFSDLIAVSMRQIAHEILKTFDEEYSCKVIEPGGGMWVVGLGPTMVIGQPTPDTMKPTHNLPKNRPTVSGEKVGRNEQCPCKSGLKYKRCCLLK
ncbi:SEC-C metal-binding domain-containing protein [Psychromonas sp. Urea-02u-13]|uniref:SEC-C metal-binding domain-containing protein n=1 Tax=Psychromonas sp. Urea-02u-13 TaxID=2058326 RepID=UPI0018E396E7|nr:SEC-C metal-binding domain-containing protein [Psychromonas sp. Urea-02u-13]